jgi:putative phage-type endonuclease
MNRIEILNTLKKQPLIKQRSDEWYKLRENRLTASDLYDAVHSPHSLIKKKIKNVTYNSFSIPALKWGCMFEKIAIDAYSYVNKTNVNEFGLLINDKIDNFGASPDGITDEGVMVEIKCPYKREIKDGTIPDKYYYQMLGQMAVCELDICDYVECKFVTYNTEEEYINNVENLENYKHGIIIEYKDNTYYYTKPYQDYKDNINEVSQKADANNNKCTYWVLELMNVQRVEFNNEKWNNQIKHKIKDYWQLYLTEKNNKPKHLFIEDSD